MCVDVVLQNVEVYLEGKSFYDFGYGNETGYYDITSTGDGRACETHSGLDEATSPTDACYVEVYSTDVFLNRARQVLHCTWLLYCHINSIFLL